MRYIGNKTELLDFIEKPLIDNSLKNGTFLDIFAGTSSVSKYFKKKNYRILSNDNMLYSYAFQKTYIENNTKTIMFSGLKNIINNPSLLRVIKYLNELKGITGFMFYNFSKDGSKHKLAEPRNYFTGKNAKMIDSMRDKIEEWKQKNMINEIEYYILLCSIIEKIPSVSNISGTYGAYLKIDDPRMFKPFLIDVPNLISNDHNNLSYNQDSNKLIDNLEIDIDITYIDPPYNHRQYPSNYHIWETVAVWDKKITNTKTGLREYENQKSLFCSKTKCSKVFEYLIKKIQSKHILFSYNSEGIMSLDTIMNILSSRGNVKHYKKEYRRYKSHSELKIKKPLEEWLFYVNTF